MEKTEKRQRFEKVASNRVQRILDTLQLLKNCSNRNNYEYNEADVDQTNYIKQTNKDLALKRISYERHGLFQLALWY